MAIAWKSRSVIVGRDSVNNPARPEPREIAVRRGGCGPSREGAFGGRTGSAPSPSRGPPLVLHISGRPHPPCGHLLPGGEGDHAVPSLLPPGEGGRRPDEGDRSRREVASDGLRSCVDTNGRPAERARCRATAPLARPRTLKNTWSRGRFWLFCKLRRFPGGTPPIGLEWNGETR